MLDEPLDAVRARTLVRRILSSGDVYFSDHAHDRMSTEPMSTLDVQNVLRGGWVDAQRTTFEEGTWRYRVTTHDMFVVVAFDSESEMSIVTTRRIHP